MRSVRRYWSGFGSCTGYGIRIRQSFSTDKFTELTKILIPTAGRGLKALPAVFTFRNLPAPAILLLQQAKPAALSCLSLFPFFYLLAMKIRWVKIAESANEIPFNEDHLAEVMANGKKLCLGWHKGEIFAFAPKCP